MLQPTKYIFCQRENIGELSGTYLSSSIIIRVVLPDTEATIAGTIGRELASRTDEEMHARGKLSLEKHGHVC